MSGDSRIWVAAFFFALLMWQAIKAESVYEFANKTFLQWICIRVVLDWSYELNKPVGFGVMAPVMPFSGWHDEDPPRGVFKVAPVIYWIF